MNFWNMKNLKTNYLGLELNSPVIVSSSGLKKLCKRAVLIMENTQKWEDLWQNIYYQSQGVRTSRTNS